MSKTLAQSALMSYFREAVDILRCSIKLERQGEHGFYRVAALQMRLLLCDTTRRHERWEDISLAPTLIPDLTLLTLVGPPSSDLIPHHLPLVEWLEVLLPGSNPSRTIRQFLRQVCDQDGGAHVDPWPRAGLENLDLENWILRIGDLVVEELEMQWVQLVTKSIDE